MEPVPNISEDLVQTLQGAVSTKITNRWWKWFQQLTGPSSQYSPGNVLLYGADPTGVNDSSAAFQAAANSGAGMILVPAGSYLISSTVTIDISKTGMYGQSATITSGLVVAGNLFEITNSQGAELATRNSIQGLTFVGQNVLGVVCFDMFNATNLVAGFSFRSCAFTSFSTFEQFRSNAFEVNHFGCTYSQQIGIGATTGGIYVPIGFTNYGERINFNGCTFFNNQQSINVQSNTCTVFVSDTSLDYSNVIALTSSGFIEFSHCYVESNIDTDNWFKTTGDGTIMLNGCHIAQTGPKPNFAICGSSASNVGQICLNDCLLYSSSNSIKNSAPYLVETLTSFGYAFGHNNRMIGFNPTEEGWAGISAASGLQPTINSGLPGFGFGSTGTGGNPFEAGGAGPGGSNGIGFQVAVNGQDQYCYFEFPCSAGDNFGVAFQAKTNNVSAPFAVNIYAFDAAGIILGSTNLVVVPITGGIPNWDGVTHQLPTSFGSVFRALFANVPANTSKCRVEWITSGATNTAYQIIIGNLGIYKY